MQANKTHISLETAKLLKDCGVESEYAYINDDNEYRAVLIEYWETVDGEWGSARNIVFKDVTDYEIEGIYAYTWQQILWENQEKFFSTKELSIGCKDFEWKTEQIFKLLQQKKYEEADLYFRKHCILIK